MSKQGQMKSKKSKREGGETKMRRMMMLFMVLCAGLIVTHVYGLTTDVFTISITPTLNYSVMIDTGGTAALGINVNYETPSQMYISTGADFSGTELTTATIYNNGNVTADWQVNAGIRNGVGGAKAWALGAADKDTVAVDSVTLCVVLATLPATVVTDGTFTNSDLVYQTGSSWHNLAGTNFNHNANGDNIPVTAGSNSRVMWYRIKLPTDTSTGDRQDLSINIRAVTSATF